MEVRYEMIDLKRCRVQLQEFGSKYEAETLRNPKKTDLADVIIYVYDSSDTNSFSYISNLRVRLISLCHEEDDSGGQCVI
jgi:hypothetical protein